MDYNIVINDNYNAIIQIDALHAASKLGTHLCRKGNRRPNFVKSDGVDEDSKWSLKESFSCNSYTISGWKLNFVILSFNFVTCL